MSIRVLCVCVCVCVCVIAYSNQSFYRQIIGYWMSAYDHGVRVDHVTTYMQSCVCVCAVVVSELCSSATRSILYVLRNSLGGEINHS